MNVLSLFDGMSCGQIALERAGIKIDTYYASEINPNSIKITQKNYSDTIQLGDVLELSNDKIDQLEKIDLLIGGSPCFKAGTLIMTNQGYKNIEDVKEGDYVLTHTNIYQKVLTSMINKSNDIYRLSTMCSEDIYVTGEHPFYCRKMFKEYHPETKTYTREFHNPIWIKAKELSKNYYVGIAINQESELPTWNGIQHIINQFKQETICTLTDKFNNNDFWWIIGRYIGDGWTNIHRRKNRKESYTYKTIICCSKLKDELKDITQKLDGLFHYGVVEERTAYKITISNQELYEYLQQFGKYAYGKFLTKDIFNLPVCLLKSFIKGYISADGCYTQNKYSITTTSKYLAYGIGACIAKAYQSPYSVYKDMCPKKCIIEKREVNQRDKYMVRFHPDIRKQDKAFYENGYVWFPINNIRKEQYNDLVYNLEVENDNSYTVNNIIVHNCQDLSITAVDRKDICNGLEGTKSKLFNEYLRIKNKINPKYFLLENVASMTEENKNEITKQMGVEPILINSSLVSAQERERLYWTNIPNITQPEDKGIILKDILQREVDEKYYYKQDYEFYGYDKKIIARLNLKTHDLCKRVYNPNFKAPTLTAVRGGYQEKKVFDNGRCRKLTPIEYEKLQTVPDRYTEGVSNSARYSMLGDGWTVDVITHIFKYIN